MATDRSKLSKRSKLRARPRVKAAEVRTEEEEERGERGQFSIREGNEKQFAGADGGSGGVSIRDWPIALSQTWDQMRKGLES